MKNYLKYTEQYQNGIFKKNISGHNGTLISIMDLPSLSQVYIMVMGIT